MEIPVISSFVGSLQISEFDLGPEPLLSGRLYRPSGNTPSQEPARVYIRNMSRCPRAQPDWAILRYQPYTFLSKTGRWIWKPAADQDHTDFYKGCRFSKLVDAVDFYYRWRLGFTVWADRQSCGYIDYDDCPSDILRGLGR